MPEDNQPKRETAEPRMLTPSEIERLRRDGREASAYGKKAFAHLRPATKGEDT